MKLEKDVEDKGSTLSRPMRARGLKPVVVDDVLPALCRAPCGRVG